MKITSWANYKKYRQLEPEERLEQLKEHRKEYPRKTIPDLSMSIEEIILRHSNGTLTGHVMDENSLGYTGEIEYPDTRKLDLVDKQKLWEYNAQRIKHITEEFREKDKARKEAIINKKNKTKELLQDFEKWQEAKKASLSSESNPSPASL